jgi:prepilin-type N-terminal cleavage/methylation domain-containing protein
VHSAAARAVATSRAVVQKRSIVAHAMNCQQEQIREARSSERIDRQCSLVFANGRQVGERRGLGQMYRHPRLQSPDGFTLIELIMVVAILGILVSVATISYNHFVIKARSVEGEIVVHEVERLEYLYLASNRAYTDNLADLGFAMTGTLRYYTTEVRTGFAIDKIGYQVRAVPVRASAADAWLLTKYRDGSTQVDRILVSDLVTFASVRYAGNAAAMTPIEATNTYLGSGMSGNNEPEWSGVGSNSRCQECGRVVITQRAVSATGQK